MPLTEIPPPLPHEQVQVIEAPVGKYRQHVRMGQHLSQADEPVDLGGENSGPNPYEFLLAALGACTSMTLRMYADRKQMPLTRVAVDLRHRKIHAQDCAECHAREGQLDQIERVITLEGDLSDEQREQLLAIANKCPVHRTLTSEIRILSRLAE
ncbi:OsmC family protein [Sinimarinibacterium sp. CAU 1509]|uniref:OsmC family protein n=1 Tax=Sinimarinibacterium sp. CAU 1509 TaxID=2562283 RepID=UPI0010AB87DE|nr:OsmC family protein [Sinimarinibacterium sp. CAU 1509]TJY62998.1 OsmC family protein [Sinimarinibacterium sp. CAU 1509]